MNIEHRQQTTDNSLMSNVFGLGSYDLHLWSCVLCLWSYVCFKEKFMRTILTTTLLLCCSNFFMTFAWYGHLKNMANRPWIIAAIVSWGIALFEYLIQVPANRIGYTTMNLGQLKILQEVITLSVFVPFSIFYMKEHFRLDYLWAGLCILGAVFFIFRPKLFGA
jgi:uncharacterized protein